MSIQAKHCPRCDLDKQTTEFTKDCSRSDGLYPICKICKRIMSNTKYKKYGEKSRQRLAKRRKEYKEIISSFKIQRGCKICEERSHPAVLEFHHTSKNKEFTVGSIGGRSKESLLNEMKKCVVLCANCHRKVHAGVLSLALIAQPGRGNIFKTCLV